jgi:hypothetical protein
VHSAVLLPLPPLSLFAVCEFVCISSIQIDRLLAALRPYRQTNTGISQCSANVFLCVQHTHTYSAAAAPSLTASVPPCPVLPVQMKLIPLSIWSRTISSLYPSLTTLRSLVSLQNQRIWQFDGGLVIHLQYEYVTEADEFDADPLPAPATDSATASASAAAAVVATPAVVDTAKLSAAGAAAAPALASDSKAPADSAAAADAAPAAPSAAVPPAPLRMPSLRRTPSGKRIAPALTISVLKRPSSSPVQMRLQDVEVTSQKHAQELQEKVKTFVLGAVVQLTADH